jgi:uncharacterized coiled-coil DUF342 family protein
MAHCEQCDEYASALLDCDSELERTKKYAETLKHHIIRSSQSTKDARKKIVELEKVIDDLETHIRHLKRDTKTMTNQELRSLRNHHLEMIRGLELKLVKQSSKITQMSEKVQEVDILVAENNRVKHNLEKVSDAYDKLERKTQKLLALTSSATTQNTSCGGVCVICLDHMAIYAHTTCGCLTYCRMCRTTIQNYRCPICRTVSTGLIKIHNLPW